MAVTHKSLVPGALVVDTAPRTARREFFIVLTQAHLGRGGALMSVNTLLLNGVHGQDLQIDQLESAAWTLPCSHYERVDVIDGE